MQLLAGVDVDDRIQFKLIIVYVGDLADHILIQADYLLHFERSGPVQLLDLLGFNVLLPAEALVA